MRMIRLAGVTAASLSVGACATAISGSAESITRLEQQHASDPQSEPLQRSLGIAYFKGNRLADARAALEKATSMDKNDGVAALYLGMTAEQPRRAIGQPRKNRALFEPAIDAVEELVKATGKQTRKYARRSAEPASACE